MSEIGEVPINVGQIKEDLFDTRAISKKFDPQGRSETAHTVKEAKGQARTIQGQIAEKSTRLIQDAEAKKLEDINHQKSSLSVRLKSMLGIKDKKLEFFQSKWYSTFNHFWDQSSELEVLRQHQKELPDPKILIEAYYEKMQTLPLTQQEKRDFLKPEVLESLTTEEYITLWRRLNPYFLSHVTRQGFRDHNAMVYHSAGMREFHGGFVGILQDEHQLRPPLAIHGLSRRDEQSVREYIKDWVLQAENQDEAKTRFDAVLHHTLASAPKYPDTTAVHFMAQTVGDGYYGGETGNEVFFVFPSDMVASQYDYSFNGWEKDFTKMQSEDKWNDVFVWPKDVNNPGISLDVGLVFLPENTPVDPLTGSKYASRVEIIDGQKKRVMIEDTKRVNAFVDWAIQQNELSPIKVAAKAYTEERNDYMREALRRDLIATVYAEIQKLGFTQDVAGVLASHYIYDFHSFGLRETTNEIAKDIISKSGAQWKRAENTVPSKQYWENYFSNHPDQQPKHIVFYDGNPHTAVYEFQQKNGIGSADTAKKDGQLLGFEDHFVANMREDPRANIGYKELVTTGNKIITEFYSKQPAITIS